MAAERWLIIDDETQQVAAAFKRGSSAKELGGGSWVLGRRLQTGVTMTALMIDELARVD